MYKSPIAHDEPKRRPEMQKPDTEEIILKALYAEAIHHGDFN